MMLGLKEHEETQRKMMVGVSLLRVYVACHLLFLLAAPATTNAHPISLSSAIVDVHEERITADIEIMLEDLVLYHELAADPEYRYSADDLQKAAKKHTKFVQDYFTIRDADGELLAGKLEELDTNKIDEEGVRQTDLMKKSVVYVLSFPVEKQQSFFTFTQTFGGPDAVLPAVMDLVLLQKGILLERPTQLALGRPHSTKFDWANPPTRAPSSLRELRKLREKQLRERLGIATYGGLYSFLYITRFEVRHEILIPLLTLEQWLPIKRKNLDFLEVDEQQAARRQVERFFQERSPISIDAQQVQPKLTRLSFFGLDINDFALNAEPRRVSVHQARVGVILSYPAPAVPHNVAMRWETFSDHAPYLRTIVLAGSNDPAEHYFRVSKPAFEWSGDLPNARVEPVQARVGALNAKTARPVVEGLLTNIYRAFECRNDGAVYDALATSVHGDLLRDIYLQVKRSLVVAEQGGAISRVTGVDIEDVVSVRQPPSTFDVTWRVTGTIEHWGHIHTRLNEYSASLAIVRDGAIWKLANLEVSGEKRVNFQTKIRGYDGDARR